MDKTYITLEDVASAREVIAGKLHRTPLLTSASLGKMCGVELFLKAELFQKTGSFKPRGSVNKLSHLSSEEKARGVISISAGNHAAGLSFAAAALGIPATIIMPEAAVSSKVEATRSYGGNVILHGTGKDLLPKALELQREHGYTFIHPFDDLHLIAGHGTVGLEILDDLPNPDMVVIGVGGGGLISGVSAVIKQKYPAARVIGVEPVGAPGMSLSLEQGTPAHLDKTSTIADGLAAPFVGEHNLAHVQRFVDEVVLVTDDEIIAAMRLIMERTKLVAEPSGAAAFAALLHNKFTVPAGARVVCMVSGGNVDRSRLKEIL